MTTAPIADDVLRETLVAFQAVEGNVTHAADRLGISRGAVQGRLRMAKKRGLMVEGEGPKLARVPTPAVLPDDDLPTGELIDFMCRRYEKRAAHKEAKKWRRFTVPTAGPYALMFFGDPHVDDNGCNWPLLKAHCELAAKTPDLYAIAQGDQSNNWTGRLARLWQEQDTSASTARKLVRWLLTDSGVPWFLWLHGNHDAWPGPVNSQIVEGMNVHSVCMEDWQAKVTLVHPSGHELRLWAAHNFPGTSQFNKLHGPQKAALLKDWAHIYAAGHHHNWALHHEENADRGFIYWLMRLRGYKHDDHYGELLGHEPQRHGSSVVAVVDPLSGGPNNVTCFADPEGGVDYLAFRKRKAAA